MKQSRGSENERDWNIVFEERCSQERGVGGRKGPEGKERNEDDVRSSHNFSQGWRSRPDVPSTTVQHTTLPMEETIQFYSMMTSARLTLGHM